MKTLYEKIVESVKNNDIGYLYKISGMNKTEVNSPVNDEGDNLLIWAIKNDMWEIVDRFLMNRELDINYKNNDGSTALNELVKKVSTNPNLADKKKYMGYIKNILLRRDIDVNVQDNNGNTPWLNILALNDYSAVSGEDFEILEDLEEIFYIRDDINVNLKNNDGDCALTLAAKANKVTTVEKLVEKFADINATDRNGNSALMIAIENGYSTLFNVLLEQENIDINVKNNNGDTAFTVCFKFDLNKDAKVAGFAKKLLERSELDVNVRNNDGNCPLIYAYENEFKEIFAKILERKDVDYNLRGANDETIMIEASRKADLNLVNYLMYKPDVDINAFDKDGMNAVMVSINGLEQTGELGYVVLNKLLSHPDLDINSAMEGKNAGNALTTAIRKENYRVIDTILEREDVDIDKPNNYTAYDSAIYTQDLDLLKRLTVNKNFDVKDEDYLGANAIGHTFDRALNTMQPDKFRALLSFLLDVCKQSNINEVLNHKNKYGDNALMTAVRRGAKWSDIELFLADVITHFGFVDIDFAAKNNAGESLEDLLNVQSKERKETEITRVIKKYQNKCDAHGFQPAQTGDENSAE